MRQYKAIVERMFVERIARLYRREEMADQVADSDEVLDSLIVIARELTGVRPADVD